jgi:pSer/pThr/pTyr-binding forkhead associated (FHA) protein
MFKLIIQDDEGKTTVVPLIRDEITIGRKEGNTIRLTERNVSRRHARILKSNGSVLVEDLESYNGVKVNGARIQGRIAVSEADRIQIGDYLLELKADRAGQVADGFDAQPTVPVERVDLSSSSPDLGKAQMRTQEMPVVGTPPPAAMPSASQKTAQMITSGVNFAGPGDVTQHEVTPGPSEPMATSYPPQVISSPARLVVVSSNFAGREYLLEKPAMIIGRAEDSEIAIDHRSISRHHAKVVQEGGSYAIVDLNSSNGLRVNGEEYGKVELRRGDVIDLGYVRFRYVAPGEDFVFERDAQIYDAGKGGSKSKGLIIGLLSLLLVGGVVAGVLVVTGSGSGTAEKPTGVPPEKAVVTPPDTPKKPPPETPPKPPDEPKPVADVVPDAAVKVAAVTPDAMAAVPVPVPQTPAAEALKFLGDANQHAQDGNWMGAMAAAEQALKLDPTNQEAMRVRDQANAELRDQPIYDKFVEAVKEGDFGAASRHYKALPESTSFRGKATPQYEELKATWLKARELRAKQYAQKGQCDQFERVVKEVDQFAPESKATFDKINCKQAVAEPTPPKPPPENPQETAALDAKLNEAQLAARVGNYAEARRKVDEVLSGRPGDQKALVTGVIASCRLNDTARAERYYAKLRPGQTRTMAKQSCLTTGIQLP